MPTLEGDRLVFRFPQIEEHARFSIDFQRTLRIPDTKNTYALPPGLGRFPVRHVEDFKGRIPAKMSERGGVIFPMWQTEAMWLSFENRRLEEGESLPVAIKIAAGKVNAVTGDPWRSGLHREPQDYIVSPDQPWLDGFAVEKGVVRQFVAMPLGESYTPEEQLTGEAEWGGIQIEAMPLKKAVWESFRDERKLFGFFENSIPFLEECDDVKMSCGEMGIAAGGLMRQEIYADIFELDDWDIDAADRVFVSLVHAKDWKAITGEAAPNEPLSAHEYSAAGLPWFDYYGMGQAALPGSKKLAEIGSVAEIFEKETGATLPKSADTATGEVVAIGPGAVGQRPVKTSNVFE